MQVVEQSLSQHNIICEIFFSFFCFFFFFFPSSKKNEILHMAFFQNQSSLVWLAYLVYLVTDIYTDVLANTNLLQYLLG